MIVVCEAEFCEPRGAKKLGTDSIKTFAGAGDQGLVRRLIKMMVLFVVPQFNNEVQHLGPAESGGYPKFYETILQAPVVGRT